ncbi:MAG: His-Xaa-Ser system radical SAM maturase HxsC [Deltaproteobacteria bacterium]|nr:His-Xaa-Ser system radical SAM maturase HxsC [Deltaproteobacteria bacterium]
MHELSGRPAAITRSFMGVISTKTSAWPKGKPLVFLAGFPDNLRKLPFRPWGRGNLAACIVPAGSKFIPPPKIPCILDVPQDHCADLRDGDVVLIAPDGRIMVVYKAGSAYNSILATNRCNSLCVMCPQPPGRDPDDLHKNNLELISLLDPNEVEQVGITGGEPTLLGEDLITLVQTFKEKLPNTLLTLLTNGRRLKDLEFARALVRAGSPNLLIETPLFADNDTEHDAIMGAKGSFYETLQGLHNLALLGQPVGLRTILHAMTIKRLTQYAAFVYQNLPFVFQVAFMGMETRGLASKNLAQLWVDPHDYQDQLAHAVRYLARRLVPVSIYNHQLCLLPRELWPFARKSITDWKQSYPPACDTCSQRAACGGVFGTGEKHSAFLHPIS